MYENSFKTIFIEFFILSIKVLSPFLVEMNINNNTQTDFSFLQLMTSPSLGQKEREKFPKFFSTPFPFTWFEWAEAGLLNALRNSQDFWESHQASLLGMRLHLGSEASPRSRSASRASSFIGGEISEERGTPFNPPFPRTRRTALNHPGLAGSSEEIPPPSVGEKRENLMRIKHGRVWSQSWNLWSRVCLRFVLSHRLAFTARHLKFSSSHPSSCCQLLMLSLQVLGTKRHLCQHIWEEDFPRGWNSF